MQRLPLPWAGWDRSSRRRCLRLRSRAAPTAWRLRCWPMRGREPWRLGHRTGGGSWLARGGRGRGSDNTAAPGRAGYCRARAATGRPCARAGIGGTRSCRTLQGADRGLCGGRRTTPAGGASRGGPVGDGRAAGAAWHFSAGLAGMAGLFELPTVRLLRPLLKRAAGCVAGGATRQRNRLGRRPFESRYPLAACAAAAARRRS